MMNTVELKFKNAQTQVKPWLLSISTFLTGGRLHSTAQHKTYFNMVNSSLDPSNSQVAVSYH
jgi:hypothetical protein